MMNRNDPVWLITGCSTGFGRELATQILARGWRAVVTARDLARRKLDTLRADFSAWAATTVGADFPPGA